MVYSFSQLESLWISNGGRKTLAPVMAAIAKAESGGRPNAKHHNRDGTIDQGLWQINSSNIGLYKGENIYDPNTNAKIAIDLAENSAGKLKNWTTYKSGVYKKYLPTLKAKVTKSFGIFTQGNFAGTDQGVDFRGSGAIPALGSGIVTDVGTSNIIEGGSYPYVIYRLTSGPYKGHFVYVAENFIPTVKRGTKLRVGQQVGKAVGTFPYIEVGFNKTGKGWNPAAPLNAANPHSSTPAGSEMWSYIQGVTGLKPGAQSQVQKELRIYQKTGKLPSTPSLATSLFHKATSAVSSPLDDIAKKIIYAFAIAGGGFTFVLGFVLIAADIGLSGRASSAVNQIPLTGAVIRGSSKIARSRRATTPTPDRSEERREELHQARLERERATTSKVKAQATESRTRQKNRRRTRKEQETAERKAYYRGATDAASPTMARIRTSKKK